MVKSSRRHDSLVPLSREHHYALMLCLRIHRGIERHQADPNWLQAKAAQAIRFFESDLTLHFRAEEEVLFPAMRDFTGARELVNLLQCEHRELESLIKRLRQTEGRLLLDPLKQFADLLETHIRQEERALFPIYEEQTSSELARQLGEEIKAIIGSALQPRNPELLK
jgi:iron-sulfur cluster repair protein YtfE (RIC family)